MAGRGLIARVLALPAFLLLAAPGFALADDIRAHEERVFKNFAGGDYYALYDAIEAMLLRFPAAPESSLYFSDLVTLVELGETSAARAPSHSTTFDRSSGHRPSAASSRARASHGAGGRAGGGGRRR